MWVNFVLQGNLRVKNLASTFSRLTFAYNGGATADFEMRKNSQLISRVMIVYASGHSSGTRFSGSGTVVVQIIAGDVLFANAYRHMMLYDIDSCFTVIKIK